jgi:hypothetical protein
MLLVVPAAANLPGSPFDAGDGNLVLDDEAQDWANAPNLQVGLDFPTGQNDNSFGQGTKEDTEIPTVVDGSIPNNKSDLLRFYVANERVAGDEFLYLAWERVQEPSGTTNMDFEFNQNATLSSNGVTPVRTAGDVLIKYDLSRGGTVPVLGYHLWVTSGDASQCQASNSVPCWDRVHDLTGNFEGAINTVPVVDPIPPDAPRTLSVRTFGEAAINLTDSGILPPNVCRSFGRAYLKSRSSDSFSSELKDFIAPIAVNIANCGRIIIRKQTDPDGAAGTFDYSTTGGLSPASFSLMDNGVQDYGEVLSGSYTVTEGDPSPGFDLVSIDCSASTGTGGVTTDLATRTVSITLAPNDVADCTFTNRARGSILIHKQDDDDPSNPLAGAMFTAFQGGVAKGSCTTGLDGNCTISDLVPGTYVVSETLSVPGHDPAPDQTVEVVGAVTVTVTFVDPRRFTIIVLVCRESDNSLYQSTVTVDGESKQSLSGTGASSLCDTGGARFEGKHFGDHPGNVSIPR